MPTGEMGEMPTGSEPHNGDVPSDSGTPHDPFSTIGIATGDSDGTGTTTGNPIVDGENADDTGFGAGTGNHGDYGDHVPLGRGRSLSTFGGSSFTISDTAAGTGFGATGAGNAGTGFGAGLN
jgi:hypothetical protein